MYYSLELDKEALILKPSKYADKKEVITDGLFTAEVVNWEDYCKGNVKPKLTIIKENLINILKRFKDYDLPEYVDLSFNFSQVFNISDFTKFLIKNNYYLVHIINRDITMGGDVTPHFRVVDKDLTPITQGISLEELFMRCAAIVRENLEKKLKEHKIEDVIDV